jgi:hypothetical protein
MKKKFFNFWIWGLISVLIITGIGIYPAFSQNPGKPAIQLMPDRGLAVLRDEFKEVGIYESLTVKARLTIINHSMQTLKIDLNGKNGNFHFEVSPKMDSTQFVNPGSYKSEVSIPGFPPMSGDMSLSDHTAYVWEIWRNQL